METKAEVLLIEDERAWQRELTRILEEGGYAVRLVDNYADAREALRTHHPTVAVVDVSLIPGDAYDRQGLQFMSEAGIPVVCVSGYLGKDEVEGLIREGRAEWFFAKQTFAGREQRFLDAVGYSAVLARHEISERWHTIEHRVIPRGD